MLTKKIMLDKELFLQSNSEKILSSITYDRHIYNFLLSRILQYDKSSDDPNKMKNYFFSKLNLNEFLENDSDTNSNPKMREYINKLKKMENNFGIQANQVAINEFNNFKKQKNVLFGDSIDILEEKIREKVGKHFSFDPFLFGDDKLKNAIIRSILDLYNFLLNANIFSPDLLFKCVFILIENIELKAGSSYAKTWLSINRQKVLLLLESHDEIFDDDLIDDEYRDGFFAANDFFYIFVHEFGHIIHYVYGLSEKKIKNLNKNFKFSIGKTAVEIIDKNLQTRFWQKNKFKYSAVDSVINEALDVIYRKFNMFGETEETILRLAKWSAVPSFYGRKEKEDPNAPEMINTEWFAEGFAYYYLTPLVRQTKIWEWWHEIFTKILPEKFNTRN